MVYQNCKCASVFLAQNSFPFSPPSLSCCLERVCGRASLQRPRAPRRVCSLPGCRGGPIPTPPSRTLRTPSTNAANGSAGLKFLTCSLALYYCACSPEVTVTSLHPPRQCRLAVFSIKPNLLSFPFSTTTPASLRCPEVWPYLSLGAFSAVGCVNP